MTWGYAQPAPFHKHVIPLDRGATSLATLPSAVVMLVEWCKWGGGGGGCAGWGQCHRGRQIFRKMWNNYARLTAILAKVRVCLITRQFILIFWPYFHILIQESLVTRGATGGNFLLQGGGDILTRPTKLSHCAGVEKHCQQICPTTSPPFN